MNKDKQKVAVLTGSSGQLGNAIRKIFQGLNIIVIGIDRIHDDRCDFSYLCDISDKNSLWEVAESIEERNGKIDILINNAGVGVFTPFEDRTEEELDYVINVNTKGTIFCCQVFLDLLKKSESPSIVNIASLYGNVSSDPRIYTDCSRNNSEIYSSTKAGIIHLSKYFAVHFSKYGIRVNCVSPGGIFNDHGENFNKNYSDRCPMGRMAHVEEIAAPVLFLSSKAASYINGHNLIVDGGFNVW